MWRVTMSGNTYHAAFAPPPRDDAVPRALNPDTSGDHISLRTGSAGLRAWQVVLTLKTKAAIAPQHCVYRHIQRCTSSHRKQRRACDRQCVELVGALLGLLVQ